MNGLIFQNLFKLLITFCCYSRYLNKRAAAHFSRVPSRIYKSKI